MGLEFSLQYPIPPLWEPCCLWQSVVLKWPRWVKLWQRLPGFTGDSLTSRGLSFPLCTVGTVIVSAAPGHAGWDEELAAWLHQVRHVAVMSVMLWPVSLQGSPRSGEMGTPSAPWCGRGNPCLHSLGRSLFICSSEGLSATSAGALYSLHLLAMIQNSWCGWLSSFGFKSVTLSREKW